MTLLACGINHHIASLDLRERLALTPDRAKMALQELASLSAVNEAMILSTCNRIEIYSDIEQPEEIHHWLATHLKPPRDPFWYFYQDQQAVSHIMRVASGLDSMVLGEPQILGQLKAAYSLAEEVGTIGNQLQRLFQRVFNVSKQVRTDTKIGANPVTLGFAIVTLAKRIFSDLSKKSVLLVGAGEVIELVALHLQKQGVKRFIIANRSHEKAGQLAKKIEGQEIALTEVPFYLKDADLVITATASDLPILGKGAIERAIKARKHQPIFMADLAVPRDIEPEVANLEDIYLYNIDDLNHIIEEGRQWRQVAAEEAENMIEVHARNYILDLRSLDANHFINTLKQNLTETSQRELVKARTKLDQGVDPKEVLNQLAYNLVNKFSHTPCIKMKQAASEGRLDVLSLASELLDLE